MGPDRPCFNYKYNVYISGQAICKSLHPDIAECMGVSMAEVTMGLVRLLFVKCPAVQMDAAHLLCRLLGKTFYKRNSNNIAFKEEEVTLQSAGQPTTNY